MENKNIQTFLKKNHLCPICAARKLLASTKVHANGADRFDNGTALTPPMGWASWNLFRQNINENIIREIAHAVSESGLKDLGYTYINADDCWMSSFRDADGRLQGDLDTFPSGIAVLTKYINALGLKMGLYTSNGTHTCEDLPASLYHERIDAETFAEWGIEYFKYDFCHNIPIPTHAPEIEKMTVSGHGHTAVYYAHEAELRGSAEVLDSDKLTDSGKFVGGLDADGGAIVFYDALLPEDGDYLVTFGIRKFGNYEKFAEITVNGTDRYEMKVPATRSAGGEGRLQLTMRFKKGANNIMIKNPVASRMDSAARQYRQMGRELQRATKLFAEKNGTPEKPICYSICEWGLNQPWKWGSSAGNLWRTTPDIKPVWTSIIGIYEVNVRLYAHAGKGNWNDPDMLEVGNGKLNDRENRAHFSLWCMMAAPLILGNDVRKFIKEDGTVDVNNSVYKIIANKEAIAIDQDRLGIPCRRIKTNGLVDVLVKPLENNEIAVCILNKAPVNMDGGFSIQKIAEEGFVDLPKSEKYRVRDIWGNEDFTTYDSISQSVEPHSVKLYRIKAEG